MDEKEKKPLTISRRVWLNSRHEGGTAFVEVSGQYSEPYFGRGGKTKDNLHEGYTECNVKIADCYRVATLDFTCHDDREFARKIAKVDRLIDTLLRVRKWLVARRFDARRKLAELKKQITKKPLTSRGSDVNSAKS